jgi:hypothetical protein
MNDRNRVKISEIALVCLIVIFAGVLRIPSLAQPIGPDQGIMAVIGEGILNGELPYRDFFEMASPAIFFTYALMLKMFGSNMAAIPITDMLVSMLTAFIVYVVARSVWDKKTGYAGALLFAFFSSGIRFGMHANGDIAFGTFWYIAQRETFMLPLTAASFYFLLNSENEGMSLWRVFLSGFLAGLAFVYKFPAMLFFLCNMIYLNGTFFLKRDRMPLRRLAVANIVIICGFVFSLIPFIVFFSMNGAVNDMVNIIFKYVYSVYGQLKHNDLWLVKTGLTHTIFLGMENFILWIFFMTSSLYIIANERNEKSLLMVLWGLVSVMYVIIHKEFFGYHYLVILPPFSLLAGYGLIRALNTGSGLQSHFSGIPGRAFVVVTILANLVVFTAIIHMHYTKFFFYATNRIAQYILANTDKDDMIFTLGGIESAIHFMTKRKSPSRFVYSWILFSYDHSRVKEAETFREELLGDLKAKTPKYIISVRSLDTFKKYSGIYDFIQKNYVLEKTFPDDRFVYVYNKR